MTGIVLAVIAAALIALIAFRDESLILGLPTDDFAMLVYSGAIALLIATALVKSSGSRLGRLAVYAAVWVSLFFVAVAAYSFRDEIDDISKRITREISPTAPTSAANPDGTQAVTVRRSLNGHFAVSAMVNGARVRMLVDTGASIVTLTQRDAVAAGINVRALSYTRPVGTANGVARVAVTRLRELKVGSIGVGPIEAFVAPSEALDESLLGLNFLNKLRSYEFRGDTMFLHGRT